MTAKRYLQQLRTLNIKIQQREEQIRELKSKAMGSGSLTSDSERVQTSISGDKMSENVSRYLDLQAEVEELLASYAETKNEIITAIQKLEDPRYIEILYKRYVGFETFDRIACDMNYNYTWICELHGQALLEFQKNRNKPKQTEDWMCYNDNVKI